jgi:hypothetical protein
VLVLAGVVAPAKTAPLGFRIGFEEFAGIGAPVEVTPRRGRFAMSFASFICAATSGFWQGSDMSTIPTNCSFEGQIKAVVVPKAAMPILIG